MADPSNPNQVELDRLLVGLARRARLLPALVPDNVVSERARLLTALERDAPVEPRWLFSRHPPSRGLFDALDAARALAEVLPHWMGEAYLARLEELEIDLHLLGALADPHGNKRARALGKRRFGTGHDRVHGETLSQVARRWLDAMGEAHEEPRTVPAEGPGSLASAMREVARAANLNLEVKVEPRLAAGAATGDRTVFLADRRFGVRESRRLIAHEILGHAVAAENGRAWPYAIFSAGSADAFADQEGLALVLEEDAGVFDPERRRTLALRVLASDWVHDGASFVEVARRLGNEHGLSPASALAIAERACRGGGVARDVAYLRGYLQVRAAIDAGLPLDALRAGRISIPFARQLPGSSELKVEPIAPLRAPSTAAVLPTTPF
jgi:hypothetical protein